MMAAVRVLNIPPPDTTAPEISAVVVGNITQNSASISWATDEPASRQVRYGPTTAYGSQTTLDTTLLTSHAQNLTGLSPDTLYNYQVVSRDAAGNEAVSANGTFRTTPASASSALAFNGTNQYVSVPDRTSLRITTNLTIEAWVKPASASGHRHIVGKHYWELSVEPSGGGYKVLFEFRGNGRWRSVTSGQLAFNQWTHVAGTYNGSVMRLFVNGVLVSSLNTTGAIDQSSHALRIGSADAKDDFFGGRIDEVRVSNVVRYTTGFTPATTPFATDANTRGLWHFSEGSGTTTADSSGNGNTGTLINGPVRVADSPLTPAGAAAGTVEQVAVAASLIHAGTPNSTSGSGPTGSGHHHGSADVPESHTHASPSAAAVMPAASAGDTRMDKAADVLIGELLLVLGVAAVCGIRRRRQGFADLSAR
jgi:hypothetical protein